MRNDISTSNRAAIARLSFISRIQIINNNNGNSHWTSDTSDPKIARTYTMVTRQIIEYCIITSAYLISVLSCVGIEPSASARTLITYTNRPADMTSIENKFLYLLREDRFSPGPTAN